jgi:hypothetical protein
VGQDGPKRAVCTHTAAAGFALASDGNFWIPGNVGGSRRFGNIVALTPSDGKLHRSLTPFGTAAGVGAYPVAITQSKDGKVGGSIYQYGGVSTGHFGGGTMERYST